MTESGSFAFVVPEQASEPLMANDFAFVYCRTCRRLQWYVAHSLMGPFIQIMVHKLVDQMSKMLLAEDDEVVEALGRAT